MANKTECDIPSFWKNRKEYSLSQIAYIAAGLEPKEFDPYFPERYLPELVKRVCADIENIFKKNAPDATPYNLTEWNTIDFERNRAIRLIDDIGGPNFLTEPEQSTAPIIEPDTELKDFERNKYLKQIAALALLLAEKSNKYKKGDKPKALPIANDIQEIFDAGDFPGKSGTGTTELRDSISKGIKLLTD
ncbi:MAG: hypothetical protein CTY19_17695 [Methylomonas sp.]|nr:MAG: hypothetical protein CTY19_17695 [Methylomonas sp.]